MPDGRRGDEGTAPAYDLIASVRVQSAARHSVAADRIGFVDAVRGLTDPRVGGDVGRIPIIPSRPDRVEPRGRERRPEQYPITKEPTADRAPRSRRTLGAPWPGGRRRRRRRPAPGSGGGPRSASRCRWRPTPPAGGRCGARRRWRPRPRGRGRGGRGGPADAGAGVAAAVRCVPTRGRGYAIDHRRGERPRTKFWAEPWPWGKPPRRSVRRAGIACACPPTEIRFKSLPVGWFFFDTVLFPRSVSFDTILPFGPSRRLARTLGPTSSQ